MEKRKTKIGHSLQDLEQNMILTLQDQYILQGNSPNQQLDILQNNQKRDIQLATYNAHLKTKIKQIAHASTSHLEAKNQGISTILPHYNDYTFKPNVIEIQQGQFIKPKKHQPNTHLTNDYQTNNKIGTQFITNIHKIKNNHQSTRKELLSFLNETAEEKDHVEQPKRQPHQIIDESLNQLRKKIKIEHQLKQSIQSKINLENQDELLLMKAMERSKRTRQPQQRAKQILQDIKQEPNQNQDKYVEIQLNPVTFKLNDQNYKQQYPINQAIKGTTSMMFVSLPSERIIKKQKEQHLPESFKEITKQQLEKMKEEIQFLQDKELGTGLAGTIKYLRQNSMIGKEEWAGRGNDKLPDSSLNHDNDRIKLEYRNKSGMLMKPKEAFRYICAAFHGEGPGKNKIEKRKKRQLMELRMKEKGNSDGSLLKMLAEHQEKTNQAHMTIHLGSKDKTK